MSEEKPRRKIKLETRHGASRESRSRKDRPCDACRSRKSACVIAVKPPCKVPFPQSIWLHSDRFQVGFAKSEVWTALLHRIHGLVAAPMSLHHQLLHPRVVRCRVRGLSLLTAKLPMPSLHRLHGSPYPRKHYEEVLRTHHLSQPHPPLH